MTKISEMTIKSEMSKKSEMTVQPDEQLGWSVAEARQILGMTVANLCLLVVVGGISSFL